MSLNQRRLLMTGGYQILTVPISEQLRHDLTLVSSVTAFCSRLPSIVKAFPTSSSGLE
jgi:hypothetical protein